LDRLTAIDDADAHAAVRAERAFLARLGAGCSLPCAALATVCERRVAVDALLAAPDGSVVVREHAETDATDAEAAGVEVAELVFARGGRELVGL
jgi:hydroxymethylbilane synthase